MLCCETMATTGSYLYVDNRADLDSLIGKLKACRWLALDSEFLREKTYFPKLCLLQVATPELVACIDPFAFGELEPLLDRIYDPGTLKVLHAARQDLEILYHLCGDVPKPVFDTQLAAPLLGLADQIGYAALADQILGVHLPKGHARTDWTQRPLPEAQLRYAADDVRYLALLYPRMREELASRGRLVWLEDDFARLSDPEQYRPDPELAWRRLPGTDRLRGQQLAVLQALAAWREASAQREDRPRGWLMRDGDLLNIARLCPRTRAQLHTLRGPPRQMLERYGEQILELVRTASSRPPPSLPARRPSRSLSPAQGAVVEALMAVVHLRGAEQALHPSALASRKDLQRLVLGERDLDLLRGWRRKIVGEDLCATLGGELELRVVAGKLQLSRHGP
jgi:ribonuclease D